MPFIVTNVNVKDRALVYFMVYKKSVKFSFADIFFFLSFLYFFIEEKNRLGSRNK